VTAKVVRLQTPKRIGAQPPRRSLDVHPSEPIEIRSAEHWRFQWHEEVLKRRDLSRSEIAIAGVIMHRFKPDRDCAEVGLTALAKAAGCSRDTARTASKRLRELGLLAVLNEGVRKRSKQGRPGELETSRYSPIYKSRGVG
jgi:hypothetical protein